MSDNEKKLLAQLRDLNRKLAVEQEKKIQKKKRGQPSKQRLLIVTSRLPVDLERCEGHGEPFWKVQVDSSYEGGMDPRGMPFGSSFFALTGEAHEFSGMRSLAPDYNIYFIGAPTSRDSNGDLCDGNSFTSREDHEAMRLFLSNMTSRDGSKCIPVFLADEECTLPCCGKSTLNLPLTPVCVTCRSPATMRVMWQRCCILSSTTSRW